MFVSVLRLSVPEMARLRIKDAYGIHRVVYDLFEPVRDSAAGKDHNASSGILYADRGMKKGWREILVVSNRCPRQGLHQGPDMETREIPEKVFGYPAYRFAITLNPVKRENASGKIVPLRTPEAVSEWFAAKAPGWGFEATHLEVESMNVIQFEKKGQRVTLGQATLSGLLHVRDAARFAQSVTRGIGRGKAFGCGLLQIAPVA